MNTFFDKLMDTSSSLNEKDNWMKSIDQTHFSRCDMNRLIMDYLVAEGFKDAAEKFSSESGVEPLINLSELDNRITIRDYIQNGEILKAVSTINDFYPDLLDNKPRLFFLLHQQQLIELIRDGKVMDAILYAQSTMAEQSERFPELRSELERTLALLAFERPENSPFAELLRPNQRQRVASEINAAILESEGKTDVTPKLAISMKELYWVEDVLDKHKIQFPHLNDLLCNN